MDNRFLFRGKRLDSGEWIQGDISRRKSRFAPQLDTTYGITDAYGTFCAVVPATIGQCTSLSASKSYRGDKPEDLLIFEGDIIRIFDDGNTYETAIYWSKSKLTYMFVNPYGVHESLEEITSCDLGFPISCGEIIGTIHDTNSPK